MFPLGLSRIPRVIGELFEEEKKQEKHKLDLYINGFFFNDDECPYTHYMYNVLLILQICIHDI